MVAGPLLQPTLNTSAEIVLNYINGAQTFENAILAWVDVKDVAKAHILVFEVPAASGRYCLVDKMAHDSEVVGMLRKLYPEIQLPEKCADDKSFVPTYQVSREKTKSLGIDFIPMEVTFKDTIESLKEKISRLICLQEVSNDKVLGVYDFKALSEDWVRGSSFLVSVHVLGLRYCFND